MLISFLKSILHNIGVLAVGFVLGFIGLILDSLLSTPNIMSHALFLAGILFLLIGFVIRVWAAYCFYQHKMKVIVLHPQKKLITDGPFQFSRNPLYLGGNVFIFFGASMVLGSICALVLTVIAILLTDKMIQREEQQLEKKFGKEWTNYKKKVRRWI